MSTTNLSDLEWQQREDRTKRKYANKKTRVGDMVFDSQKELDRWNELVLLTKAGHITELRRQVPFVLVPAVRMGKAQRLKPAIRLIVDFMYRDQHTGKVVLEDSKGVVTDVFKLKLHLLKDKFGMEVLLS